MNILIATAVLVTMTASGAAQSTTQQTPPPQAPRATDAKPAVDVTGKWDVMVSTGQGDIPATLTLKKEADKIVGFIVGAQGEAPVEATLQDKTISIWFSMESANGPVPIAMQGTVEGNTIKGSVDIGGASSASWSATRAAAPAPAADPKPAAQAAPEAGTTALNVTGTWALEVNTPAGSGTPTLVLKQDGEKLSGTYTSNQFGDSAVTGTLKGSAISFAFDLNLEGNAVTVVYTGKVEKDSMSGTLKFGEYADGTFTGKKK